VLAAKFELGFCTCRRCNDWPPLVRAPTMALPGLFAPFNSPAGPSVGSSQPPYLFVRLFTVVPFSETVPNLDVVQGFTPFFDCIPSDERAHRKSCPFSVS
jgi:hypothetical protein